MKREVKGKTEISLSSVARLGGNWKQQKQRRHTVKAARLFFCCFIQI